MAPIRRLVRLPVLFLIAFGLLAISPAPPAHGQGNEKKAKKDSSKGEGKKAGKDEGAGGSSGGKGDDEGDGGEGYRGPGKIELSPEEEAEVKALEEPSEAELDLKSPRFVSKEPPAFVIVRPVPSKAAKKAAASAKKGAPVLPDGERWGFVDMGARKKRIGSFYDKLVAHCEKVGADEKATEADKTKAEKDVRFIRAEMTRVLKDTDKIRCRVELKSNKLIGMEVHAQDYQPAGGEKALWDAMRRGLESQGLSIQADKAEKKGRVSGHTFTCKRDDQWFRRSIFIVPKQRGVSLVLLDCRAPQAEMNEQMTKDFDAFLEGTSF
jgi:hypothetical protein